MGDLADRLAGAVILALLAFCVVSAVVYFFC
jgi:hypothetical protein